MSNSGKGLPANISTTLSELRKAAGLKQSDIARKLTVDASKVSRIESGDVSLIPDEAEEFLNAIGSQEAEDFRLFLKQRWEILERPSFKHPQRENLYQAELSLQKLQDFSSQENSSAPLYGEAKMHEESLRQAAEYLSSLRHSVAYVGNIGVGKTTAICTQTDLLLPEKNKARLPRTALEVGSGGTTVCEVRIRQGQDYSIRVEPQADTEIYQLAEELCAGIYDDQSVRGNSPTNEESEIKEVSKEIDRVLRNMTGLLRLQPHKKLDDGNSIPSDSLKELAEESESFDALCSEFNQRLALWERKRREIFYDSNSNLSPKEWLQKTFIAINNGRHKEFSLPKRIDILIPDNPLEISNYEVEIIDTKGIDKTLATQKTAANRADLQACIDDSRILTMLCSGFKDAPGATSQSIIEHLNQTGQSNILEERLSLLLLPQSNEAEGMKYDNGEEVETVEDGYNLKKEVIKTDLRSIGAGNIPVYCFNSASDDPRQFNAFIASQIVNLREGKIRRISATSKAVDYLIEHQEEEQVRAVRREVSRSLKIFLDRHLSLPEQKWNVHSYLIKEINNSHPRTVWASMRRQGFWSDLNIYFILGRGARGEAYKAINSTRSKLIGILENMLGNPDMEPSHIFLNELISNWNLWCDDFLKDAEDIGREIFRTSLREGDIYPKCAQIYGQGIPFRSEVVRNLKRWFEAPEQEHLYSLLETRISDAWQERVMEQLRNLADEEDHNPS